MPHLPVRPSRALAALVFAVAVTAAAEAPAPADRERVAWFGAWDAGLSEARRTGRPILLVAAAPHCHQVPGIW
jgi:hypothetical protein